jgi:hypothetical protein
MYIVFFKRDRFYLSVLLLLPWILVEEARAWDNEVHIPLKPPLRIRCCSLVLVE